MLLLSGYRRKRQKGQSRQWVQRKDGRLCQTHAEFQRRLLRYGAGEALTLLLHIQTPTQHEALLEYHHVMFNDTMPLFIYYFFKLGVKIFGKFPIYSSCQVYCEMWEYTLANWQIVVSVFSFFFTVHYVDLLLNLFHICICPLSNKWLYRKAPVQFLNIKVNIPLQQIKYTGKWKCSIKKKKNKNTANIFKTYIFFIIE